MVNEIKLYCKWGIYVNIYYTSFTGLVLCKQFRNGHLPSYKIGNIFFIW